MSNQTASAPRILIVEARFYDGIADALLDGAKTLLDEAGATYDVVTVPGALDGADEDGVEYDGFVALGCVIRGETHHFDIVANESARALMNLAVAWVSSLLSPGKPRTNVPHTPTSLA